MAKCKETRLAVGMKMKRMLFTMLLFSHQSRHLADIRGADHNVPLINLFFLVGDVKFLFQKETERDT